MKILQALKFVALLAPLSGCATQAPAELSPQAASGRALLARYCAECHAIGPAGRSASRDAPEFRNLWRQYNVEGLGEALAEGIMVGHGNMPEVTFPAADVDAILVYLASIQTGSTKAQ